VNFDAIGSGQAGNPLSATLAEGFFGLMEVVKPVN
jgi:hypothetical protein